MGLIEQLTLKKLKVIRTYKDLEKQIIATNGNPKVIEKLNKFIEKHKDILRNPEIRRNGNIQEILNHMEQHEQFISQQQQAMMPQQPGQPPPPPGDVTSHQQMEDVNKEPAMVEDMNRESKPATPAEPEVSF